MEGGVQCVVLANHRPEFKCRVLCEVGFKKWDTFKKNNFIFNLKCKKKTVDEKHCLCFLLNHILNLDKIGH